MNSCHECDYLEWGYGDVNDPEGYICNKREYKSDEEESKHISKLKNKQYRMKAKSCFVQKNAGVEVVE